MKPLKPKHSAYRNLACWYPSLRTTCTFSPVYDVTWGGRLEFASFWLLFLQNLFLPHFSSRKAGKCSDTACSFCVWVWWKQALMLTRRISWVITPWPSFKSFLQSFERNKALVSSFKKPFTCLTYLKGTGKRTCTDTERKTFPTKSTDDTFSRTVDSATG